MDKFQYPELSFKYRHQIIQWIDDKDLFGLRFIANLLSRIIIPKPSSPVYLNTTHGFKLWIDPILDQGVEKSLYYTGTYERGTLSVIKDILGENDVFVDIGANIGLMSIYASKIVGVNGKVYSFEPNPNTYEILTRNIEINSCSNILASQYAIGDKKQSSLIFDNWNKNRGSSSIINYNESQSGYEINIDTLEHLIEDYDDIDLIKIDVEGYELQVLFGMRNILESMQAPNLIIECSESNSQIHHDLPKELYEFILSTNNYRVFKSKSNKKRRSPLVEIFNASHLPRHDNIYCISNSKKIIMDKILNTKK